MFIIFYLNIFLFCLERNNANKIDTLPEQGTDGRMQNLRNLCPYNKFCGSDPIKEIERPDHESCCEECSCENDCFETGSCCPDMPLSGLAEPKYPCKHLWDFGKVAANMVRPSDHAYWHHIIDDCPEKWKAHSYPKCLKPTNVRDYVIVSDTSTGKLYRNKHCAECNGIQKYVKLQLQMRCKDIQYKYMFSLSTAAERENNVMENCSLTSLPPDMRVGLSQCLPKKIVISACNSSGEWDNYDNETERGCVAQGKDQNTVFRAPILKEGLYDYYANVFCFLCNVPTRTKKADSCKIIKPKVNEKNSFVNLRAILDLKMWGDEDEVVTKESTCSSTQIWDPYSELCREMFCPNGLIPVRGTCKGYFNKINGYNIAIHFKVIFTKKETIDIDLSLLNILKNHITRELGNELTCGMCLSMLLTGDGSTSQLFFRQEIFTTDDCPYDALHKRIRKLAIKKNVYVKFRNRSQVIRIVLVLIFEDIKLSTGYKQLFKLVTTFCPFAEVIDSSILLFCPTIVLPKHVVYELGLDNSSDTSSLISPQANHSETLVQHVCVEHYFSAKQGNSASFYAFTIYDLCKWLLLLFITLS